METSQRRPKEPCPRHADSGVARDDRNIRHERQLESSTQCIAAHLGHCCFRVPLKVVVKRKGPSIDRQLPALARSTLPLSVCPVAVRFLRVGTVPSVRVVHIGPSAEDTAFTSQYNDFYVVVICQLIKVL